MYTRVLMFALLATLVSPPIRAQVGINNSNPAPSSALDVTSTNRGVLLPRLSTTQMTSIASPAMGLAIYNTDSSTFCVYTGSAWVRLLTSASAGTASSGTITESDPKVGSLSTNFLPVWNGTTLENSRMYQRNGNIGIGTSTPQSPLEVAGKGRMWYLQLTGGAVNGYLLQSDNQGNAVWTAPQSLLYSNLTDGNVPRYSGTGLSSGTLYDDGSRVGIGTTDPQAGLHLQNKNLLVTDDVGSGSDIEVTGSGNRFFYEGSHHALRSGGVSGSAWDPSNIGAYSTALGYNNQSSGRYAFAAGSENTVNGQNGAALGSTNTATEENSVAIGRENQSSGYAAITIGTLNSALGHHSIATGLENTAYSFAESVFGTFATNYTAESDDYFNTNDRLLTVGNGTNNSNRSDALTILKNGNLGIGTSMPTSKLEVNGSTKTTSIQVTDGAAAGYLLQSDASGNASWVAATTLSVPESDPQVSSSTTSFVPRWTGSTLSDGSIYDDGTNVGIGTATPGAKLEVSGKTKTNNFQMTSGASSGYVLQCDASGTGTWVAPTSLSVTETDPRVSSSTLSYVPRWTGTTLSDGTIYDNGSNVGIGTALPGAKLDVSGKTKTTSLQVTSGATAGYVLQSDASGTGAWVASTSLSVTETDPQVSSSTTSFIPRWTGTTLSDGAIYDDGTRIGIGATSIPTESNLVLGAQAASAIEGGQLQLNGAGSNTTQYIDNYNGNLRFMTGTTSASTTVAAQISATGMLGLGSSTTPVSTLDVYGSVAMRVRASLAAGTTNPDATAMVWVYSSGTGTITLPAASGCANRIYIILNQTGSSRTMSSYKDLGGTSQSSLANSTSITIASDGTQWLQIR